MRRSSACRTCMYVSQVKRDSGRVSENTPVWTAYPRDLESFMASESVRCPCASSNRAPPLLWGAGRRGAGRPAHSRPSSHSTRSRRAADAAPRHAQRVAAARCPLPSAAAACIASHQRSTPATGKHSPRNARPDLCRRLPAAQVPNKQQTVGVCDCACAAGPQAGPAL